MNIVAEIMECLKIFKQRRWSESLFYNYEFPSQGEAKLVCLSPSLYIYEIDFLFLLFFCYAAQLYIGQQHAKKLQSNQFWIVYFLAAGRPALCIMILHIPELLVLHIKCACDDKESR